MTWYKLRIVHKSGEIMFAFNPKKDFLGYFLKL